MKKALNIVKVGGQVVEDRKSLDRLLEAFCSLEGCKALVVGGGRKATALAAELGIETKMIDGRRITDARMLDVVTMVYAGLVNKNIVAGLQARGIQALGLSGADLDSIRSDRRKASDIDYGYVGDPAKVNMEALKTLLENGITPVFCAITHDGNGQLLNTNADTVASALACALAGEYEVKLTFCFEKSGVLAAPEDEDSVIRSIDRESYARYIAQGTISGGMIPKLDNAFKALEAGVHEVTITKATALGPGEGTTICLNC